MAVLGILDPKFNSLIILWNSWGVWIPGIVISTTELHVMWKDHFYQFRLLDFFLYYDTAASSMFQYCFINTISSLKSIIFLFFFKICHCLEPFLIVLKRCNQIYELDSFLSPHFHYGHNFSLFLLFFYTFPLFSLQFLSQFLLLSLFFFLHYF